MMTQNSTHAMSVERPLISIIMPTYNAARYIGKAIQSVLGQTYPHWELIIVDDASSDDTEAVVQGFDDTRIRYHKVSRIGHPAGVRNTGLKMAQGALIAFLDSDDLYFPQSLEKLSRPLLNNPHYFAVYGFEFSIDEHDAPLPQAVNLIPRQGKRAEGEPPYQLPPSYGHSWEQIVTSKITNMLPALILRRGDWEQIGFFNENLCGPEDYEFYVRMFLHNYEGVYCLSDYVYQYRIHSASLTKTPEHYQKLLDSCLKIMQWMFDEAAIPEHALAYKSKAHIACYRYLARERLLNHQPAIARKLAIMALKDKNVHLADFMKQCGPILIRSFLPSRFDYLLVQLRRTLRSRAFQNPVFSYQEKTALSS